MQQRDDGGLADLETIAADYQVVEELGRGSSGVVWRARDLALERDVAIKVVRAAPGDDELLERSAQEARLVARLPHHPNIVAIHAVRRLGPRALALVMQHVPGGTLRDRLVHDGAMDPEAATGVLRDLARALHFAHGAGIVHRDVKPENVYLDATTGRALLSDFGAATLLHADARRTAVGAVIGTPAYMSPEQLAGSTVDGRSDIYSVGLVGWEMLTGRFPWGTSNLYEILYRQRHTELAPIDELRPGLPAPIVNAVEGALERDPAERWPSAAAFLAALLAPDDVPRRARRITHDLAPATLATAEVPEQHARTLQLAPEGEGEDDWRPDARDPAWREALAAMPPSPRRRLGRRALAALAGIVGAGALVVGLALRDDDGVGEAGAREVAGEVATERALARDLAAAAGTVADPAARAGGDPTAGGGVPPIPAPVPAVPSAPDAIAARCASTALADQRACLLARLADHDERLNATYADLVRALRVRDGGSADGPDTPSVRRLRERQRAWIMGRDRGCREAGVARAGRLWAEERARCLGAAGERWTAMLERELASVRGG